MDVCAACGDSKWTEGDNGLIRCPTCAPDPVERFLEASHIPGRFVQCRVATFQTPTPQLAAARESVVKFISRYEPGDGILLHGPSGVGKSHICCATLRHLISKRVEPGLFVDYRHMFTTISNTYDSDEREAEVIAPFLDAPILLLDDLGARRPTDWLLDTLGVILGHRYNNELSTICTTNLSGDQLARAIGQRMFSRLHQMCEFVPVQGRDWRQ